MLEIIRRLKPAYSIYNFFQHEKLSHNTPIYQELGLRKKYYSPISSAVFTKAGLDMSPLKGDGDFENVPSFLSLSAENKRSVLDFDQNGYAILKNFIRPDEADEINALIDQFLDDGTVKFRYGNKIMFAIHKSAALRAIGERSDLIEILTALMGREAVLFQSINFINGSEQRTHSDSIHMTTYPLGGLIACWLALEDVEPEQGALHYYPGSHKLPYYLNKDYDNEGTSLFTGNKTYGEYEDFMEKKILELGLQKEVFRAKKGDLLIWHANLFHGGEPHTNRAKTRKSMVFHYFAKGVVCYHEITQRPALIEQC